MDVQKIQERLYLLEGTWKGAGAGQYPTIDSFQYQETVTFEIDKSYPLIHYIQRTYLSGSGEPSHWESGFIRVIESGAIEISNSQDSGRVEVLRGENDPTVLADGELKLDLHSVFLGNDPRLVKTRRVICVSSDIMSYTKYMSTNTTPEPSMMNHLKAELKRV